MLRPVDDSLLALVPDYRINLLSPMEIADEDLSKFRTDIRQVMEYIRLSRDRKRLHEAMIRDDHYKNLDLNTARLINEVTGAKLKLTAKEGKVNMWNAIDDIRVEAEANGEARGENRKVIFLILRKASAGQDAKRIAEDLMESLPRVETILRIASGITTPQAPVNDAIVNKVLAAYEKELEKKQMELVQT